MRDPPLTTSVGCLHAVALHLLMINATNAMAIAATLIPVFVAGSAIFATSESVLEIVI